MYDPHVSILIPLFNEEKIFPLLIRRLNKVMEDNADLSIEVVLVDDGSKDDTAMLMQTLSYNDHRYQSVFLSRNFGHQLALSAGLTCCKATAGIFIIDGDLQDPPELLPHFFAQLQSGHDVVYAVRKKRKEGWWKKIAYALFYRLFNSIAQIDMPLDSGDFCMISRRVADILCKMPEESRFLRGMRSWMGFSQTGLEYERSNRAAGRSKYSLPQLIRLAYTGIFNFSEFPVKFIKRIGYFAIGISIVYLLYNLYTKIFDPGSIPVGYTSLLFTIVFFGGLQFVAIGILGEYIIRIFFQVKNRPLFIVKEKIERGNKTGQLFPD